MNMLDVSLAAGKQIVGTDDFVSARQQTIDKMATQETRAPGNKDSLTRFVLADILHILKFDRLLKTNRTPTSGCL